MSSAATCLLAHTIEKQCIKTWCNLEKSVCLQYASNGDEKTYTNESCTQFTNRSHQRSPTSVVKASETQSLLNAIKPKPLCNHSDRAVSTPLYRLLLADYRGAMLGQRLYPERHQRFAHEADMQCELARPVLTRASRRELLVPSEPGMRKRWHKSYQKCWWYY